MILMLPKSKKIWVEIYENNNDRHEMRWFCNQVGVLICVTKGELSIRSDQGSYVISSGMAVYIPPNNSYLEQSIGLQVKGWIVRIPPKHCASLAKELIQIEPTQLLCAAGNRLSDITKSSKNKKFAYHLSNVLLNEIATAPAAIHPAIPLPVDNVLLKIAEMILKNPSDSENIDYWSKSAGMSRRNFTRIFLKETGISFSAWRRRVKISASIKELAKGKTVGDISFELGYQNPSAFIAMFKKCYGMSPSRFLKKFVEK